MIYFACPVKSDFDFDEKRSIVQFTFKRKGIGVYFPLDGDGVPSHEYTLNKVRHCRAFIADLSKERPSVYFELGLASASNKPIYLLAKEGTKIHQTGDTTVLAYSDIESYNRVLLLMSERIIATSLIE